jgi:surface polysaccharide O-acyltransferase-like enzyme
MPRPFIMSRSSIALDNLRAVVILIVLGFHSVLAYVKWIPVRAGAFDAPPYGWRSFPIVDNHRWLGFDLFCAWQDVYLMSLMFFLSGLFVWSSLTRKKSLGFVRDRVRRLGIPYVFGVAILIPIAMYPSYRATGADPSVSAYLHEYLALPFRPNGQLWFLWQLLVLNFVAAGLNVAAPRALAALGPWSAKLGQQPALYFAVLVCLSAVAYVPSALVFTPWAWSDSGWFAVQWCRPLLYGVYFFAGVGIGAAGIDRGLTAADGALGRQWKLWFSVAIVSLAAWMGATSQTMGGDAPIALELVSDLSFVVACASGCFFVIAAALHFGGKRSRILDGLSLNAYSLYLVHYDFVVWLQYALLGSALFALIKGAIVFAATVALSWIAVVVVERVPFGAWLIGALPPRPSPHAQHSSSPPPESGLYARLRNPSRFEG